MKKGFTLIELLIVVAIVAILAVLGIISFSGILESSKDVACKNKHAFITSWFETEMMQCRLGIQPHAEVGRGDQTYDFPDYGFIKNDPRYPSCRGSVEFHAEGIGQGWGYRYMNPYKRECDDTKENCHPYKGVKYSKTPPEKGDMHVWGYYEVLSLRQDGLVYNGNVHITFTSLCGIDTLKRDIITSHIYEVSKKEYDKRMNVSNKSNESNSNESNESNDDSDNGYLSTNEVY